MGRPFRVYTVRKKDGYFSTMIPGRYAGNLAHHIFGRLDCKSGLRMKKESRVFFANYEDAIAAGYAECLNCNPTPSDKYPELEAVKEALLAKPHIALWKLGRKQRRVWTVCLNWQDKNSKQGNYRQVTLSNSIMYARAREIAIREGRKYNLPVMQHGPADFANIWIPTERTNQIDIARDRKALKELLQSKKVIGFPSMF